MIKPMIPVMTAMLAATTLISCSRTDDPVADASTGPSASPSVETLESDVASSGAIDSVKLPVSAPLPQKMDCVRSIGALTAAHRGGPRRGFPENSLETLQESYNRGTRVFEIDVAESKDGVLFLMHDVNLRRTTTREGVAREMNWSELSAVTLTANGADTGFLIPTLRETLEWAVETNSLVELDKKRSTDFAKIIDMVKEANAENNVILITYTQDQAETVASLAPDMMMTASVSSLEDLETLLARGVKLENLIAWAGTSSPNPVLWMDLKARGIEIAFGTLGRRGERLDDQYWSDGDGSEYDQLVRDGATLIATDYSDKVTRHLTVDDDAIAACGF